MYVLLLLLYRRVRNSTPFRTVRGLYNTYKRIPSTVMGAAGHVWHKTKYVYAHYIIGLLPMSVVLSICLPKGILYTTTLILFGVTSTDRRMRVWRCINGLTETAEPAATYNNTIMLYNAHCVKRKRRKNYQFVSEQTYRPPPSPMCRHPAIAVRYSVYNIYIYITGCQYPWIARDSCSRLCWNLNNTLKYI